MITLILTLLKLAALAICLFLSVICIFLAMTRRKQKKAFVFHFILATVFLVAAYIFLKVDFTAAETTDREEAAGAFESNFGFIPPGSVKEIKLKNFSIYDGSAHWMAFSYDSIVFKKILDHDQPLSTAFNGTQKFSELLTSLEQSCGNCPGWLRLPHANTNKIFYKENFLRHSRSEYYLWVNSKEKMVYLEVSYSD